MSINRSMDKHIVVYTYSGIIFNNQMKWPIDNTQHVYSQNNYTEWKKLEKRIYTTNNSTYVKFYKMPTNV